MKILRVYIRAVEKLTRIIALTVSVLMPAMVCVLGYEVVSRYIFGRPTVWAFDVSIFMFGYTGLLAGAYVHRLREHINVDIVYGRVSPRKRAVLDLVNGLLILYFIILTIMTTWGPAFDAIVNHETRPGEWAPPIGHYKLMIPAGAFLILLQQISNWIKSLYLAITGKEMIP